jgi:translation initiation factor IF-3
VSLQRVDVIIERSRIKLKHNSLGIELHDVDSKTECASKYIADGEKAAARVGIARRETHRASQFVSIKGQ